MIRSLLEGCTVVAAAGSGGIPVARDASERLIGIEAVIGKDSAAALIAAELEADLLVIPTGVDRAAIGFGTPDETWLDTLSPEAAADYAAADHFGEGSMEPRIDAVLAFLRDRSTAASLITSPDCFTEALARSNRTWIENNPSEDPLQRITHDKDSASRCQWHLNARAQTQRQSP